MIQFAFITFWGFLALLTAVTNLQADPGDVAGSSADFEGFVNAVGNPEEVVVDTPTIGSSSNPIAVAYNFGKFVVGWIGFMARAALLQGDIWEPWTALIRYPLVVFGAIFIYREMKEVIPLFSNFIGGLFGRVT